MDDAVLLRAWCAHRDETALAALMERHTCGLRAALHRRLHDPAQVEDAVQAVWITLTRKAASVRDPARLVGWLHACAGRIALDIQRAEASRRAAERAAGHALAAMATGADPDDPVAELRPRLDAALARVSPASREAILRHYLHGQPQTVAAAACGISENAFAKRVEYGLDQLRRLLGARRRPAGAAVVMALLAGEGRAAAAEPAAPPVAAIMDPATRVAELVTGGFRHGSRTPWTIAAVSVLTIFAVLVVVFARGRGLEVPTPPARPVASLDLDQVVAWSVTDRRIGDAVQDLARATGIPMRCSVPPGDQTAVTVSVRTPLRGVLDMLSALAGTTWRETGGVIVVGPDNGPSAPGAF
jgi:RNA polymerase sigma factor (sigma-70 family)